MSWVNDLVSLSGLPAGAATLGVAMYAACAAAEKVARPEALKDIGRILKDPSWSRSVRPSAIIERMFNWTFGERHISIQCVYVSAAASLIFDCVFALIPQDSWKSIYWLQISYGIGSRWLFNQFLRLSLWPDYIALAKTRLTVKMMGSCQSYIHALLLVLLDIVVSIMISFIGLGLYLLATGGWSFSHWAIQNWFSMAEMISNRLLGLQGTAPNAFPFTQLAILSTLLTSIWTILILLSTTVIKLLAPIHRFTAWFFDVEKHPVRAIGIVAGALVMVGSLIWTVVKALI
jgi:hypothetical protein